MFFNWLFRRKPRPAPYSPLDNAPMPMRGSYEVLPLELADFDWTDWDRAFLTVDGDGTVKLHDGHAWLRGNVWKSLDYMIFGWITPPGNDCAIMYWLRPSWYDEKYGVPATVTVEADDDNDWWEGYGEPQWQPSDGPIFNYELSAYSEKTGYHADGVQRVSPIRRGV